MNRVGQIFKIGMNILSTSLDEATNVILAQLGSVTEEYTYADDTEWYQDVGLASRPANANKGEKAAECVSIQQGGTDTVIASRDARGQKIYGKLKPGETCLYAAGGDGKSQGRVMLKDNGNVVLYTTSDNTDAGQAVYLTLAPDGLTFKAPWGSMTFDANGFHLKTIQGPAIDLGGIAIPLLPSTISAPLTSYANISAGTVTLAGSTVLLGNGPAYAPVISYPANSPPAPTPINIATVNLAVPTAAVQVSIV